MNKREFTKLFHEHADSLYRFAFWRVGDEDKASDIVSTVFTKAWEKRETFDGKFPKAWLYTIARRTIIDSYRKKSEERLSEDAEIEVHDYTAEDIDRQIDVKTLLVALDSLSDELREIIHWRFIERASVQETAKQTGHTEANVRVMQFRALKKLRLWYEKRQ
ncbi:MAG: sigma-70 family RNA polymerase sigma factor [bacterium]